MSAYQQMQGVIIGDKFLTKEDFKKWFGELLTSKEAQELAKELAMSLNSAVARIGVPQVKRGITQFDSELDILASKFLEFSALAESFEGRLGGNISIISTFNFLSGQSSDTYFIADQNELPSSKNSKTGAKLLYNTQSQLQALVEEGKKINRMNQHFQSHLQNFYVQLQEYSPNAEDRRSLYIWAWYQMRQRYKKMHRKTPVSMSEYFWGHGHDYGYVSEAYTTHLILHHNIDFKKDIAEFSKTVIEEEGGYGSSQLFTLLKASKGNIKSQISGDIVVVDQDGRVTFNIQSKATRGSGYSFEITYKKFLTDVQSLINIYLNWGNDVNQQDKDLEFLFQKFSTNAWVPISKKVNDLVNKDIEILTNKLSSKK